MLTIRFGVPRISLLLVSALWLLTGCASSPSPKPDLLAFLEADHVTRTDVIAHLGAASASFDRDGVVAYRVSHNDHGFFVAAPMKKNTELDWEGINYDLVLAFDEAGVLSEHRLIAVHEAPASPH